MSRRTAWFLMGIGGLLLVLIAAGGYWLSTGPALGLPRAFIMEGESMEPTLKTGDRFFIRPLPQGASPVRGDIVLFTDPSRPTLRLVKRVIAVAGDKAEIRNGTVWLNGAELVEPYLGLVSPGENMALITVPEGQVWVLGDNRARSFDSRQLGPIPVTNIEGVRVR